MFELKYTYTHNNTCIQNIWVFTIKCFIMGMLREGGKSKA